MFRRKNSSPPQPVAENASGPPITAPSRATWSGLLRLSLVVVPVKAYPATSTTDAISFHQLHAGCGQRINYHKVCPIHGKLDSDRIVRAYQYAPDQYVVVEDSELESLRPPKDQGLVLEQCIPADRIEPALFAGRTLYLVPEGLAAQRPYLVLHEALRRQNKAALGWITLAGHRHVALVRPNGRLLSVHLLHAPAKVRPATALEAQIREAPANPEEQRLAAMLIESASTTLDWSRYRDDTAEKLTSLIETKLAGRQWVQPAEEPVQVLQLLEALQQSVAAATQKGEAGTPKPRTRARRSA